ncbi:MAG: EAL domain-containing protein [Hydrogenophilaceae bacterium]|nr:EAL domain-containing protein [Hydrogenophilaceae bacterium]
MQSGKPSASASTARGADVRSERLYVLWSIATRRHLSDEERIQAILEESCRVLGVEVALVGELREGQYRIHYAFDEMGRFPVGMEMPLASTPCQRVVESGCSVYLPDMPDDPAMKDLPAVTLMNLRVYVGTPIWLGSQFWGVLAFAGAQSHGEDRTQENLSFIELIASWIGSSLLQARQRFNLEKLALTDALTNLPNRRAAETRLKEEISHARRHGVSFILGLIDLDHFKLINDRYGHAVGDEMLIGFADALKSYLRMEDWVARWGGEEFIVCLHTGDMDQAELILDRLRSEIGQKAFQTSVGDIHLTLSIGLSRFDPASCTQDTVLADLDNTLYEAKASGRDRIVSDRKSRGILHTATLLKTAVSENRIHAAYQTIFSLGTLQPVADEALARLITPQGEIVPAAEFIEAAEGLGLMADIDDIVASQTLRRCARNLASGVTTRNFVHFINLSPQFLARHDLVGKLLTNAQNYCSQCGIEMDKFKPVVFEITERQAIQNLDTLEHDLRYLLDFGFRLALDDFGSGYSSFIYLARLPISFLKIEGWMVQNMQSNSKVLDLVKSLVAFSRNQGIVTIAECVEDATTLKQLQEVGVDWAQGYHFSRPALDLGQSPPVSQIPASLS